MDYAREDISARMLKEQQVEAKRVIEAIDSALTNDGEILLSGAEMAVIVEARNDLEKIIDTACAEKLKKSIKAMEQVSEAYVAKRMNASVNQALTGKQIDEVEV